MKTSKRKIAFFAVMIAVLAAAGFAKSAMAGTTYVVKKGGNDTTISRISRISRIDCRPSGTTGYMYCDITF